MKKDRNCGTTPYPIYPPYQGMGMMPYGMPNMMSMNMIGGYPNNNQNISNISSNTIEQQLNTLQQQINSLENRISTIENMVNNSNSVLYSNNYNSSNYQMM